MPLGSAEGMKTFGDAFIKMIKMLIAPIIFCTVVHGIANVGDMKKVGRVGLSVINTLRPGVGMNVDAKLIDTKAITTFVVRSKEQGVVGTLMHIIPDTVVSAFAEREILQLLFFAVLFAVGLQALGKRGEFFLAVIEQASQALFGVVAVIMKVAPIGAFGAMAFTTGRYGLVTPLSLGQLMLAFYTTCLIFVFVVLGIIAAVAGFNIFSFVRYIKEELLIVLGTSSSESVLPRMIAKMEISAV